MSMSRVPWSTFARCRVCLAMVDIRPPIGGDGRHSTVDLSRAGIPGLHVERSLQPESTIERAYGKIRRPQGIVVKQEVMMHQAVGECETNHSYRSRIQTKCRLKERAEGSAQSTH